MDPKEEQTNSKADLENESSKEKQKDTNYINEIAGDTQLDEK